MTRFTIPASLFIAGLALCYWFTTSIPELSNLGLFYRSNGEAVILSQGLDLLSFSWKALLGMGLVVASLLFLIAGEWAKDAGLADAEKEISKLQAETARAKHQAATADKKAQERLSNERKHLESLQKDAESKLSESLAVREETEKKLSAVVTEAKKRLSEGESKIQDASTKKEHASAAMQRYKRKLESLKSDYSKLIEFAKQYHPDQF